LVEKSIEVITGADDNDIKLYISKPKSVSGSLPGVVHLHGGGMCVFSANDRPYHQYRNALAQRGFVVVSVEFRNSSGKLGPHPFPAGLNDCMSGLEWVSSNKQKLGISKLILSGESGGGNLCLAMAIRAKQEAKLGLFDGVYTLCPFIAGPEVWKAKSLQSLRENEDYFVSTKSFGMLARTYDPDYKNINNPCAWPFQASIEDLEGLPPHFVRLNELDPLRDEGLEFSEKLKKAGVCVDTKIVEGTPHSSDVIAGGIDGCEHFFDQLVDSMKDFVVQSLK